MKKYRDYEGAAFAGFVALIVLLNAAWLSFVIWAVVQVIEVLRQAVA